MSTILDEIVATLKGDTEASAWLDSEALAEETDGKAKTERHKAGG